MKVTGFCPQCGYATLTDHDIVGHPQCTTCSTIVASRDIIIGALEAERRTARWRATGNVRPEWQGRNAMEVSSLMAAEQRDAEDEDRRSKERRPLCDARNAVTNEVCTRFPGHEAFHSNGTNVWDGDGSVYPLCRSEFLPEGTDAAWRCTLEAGHGGDHFDRYAAIKWSEAIATTKGVDPVNCIDEPLIDSVLLEAQRLVHGPRQADYGHPLDNWSRTADLWSVILGHPVNAEQALKCMVAVKLARQIHKPSRDNLVDACGYIECIDLVLDERKRRALNPPA